MSIARVKLSTKAPIFVGDDIHFDEIELQDEDGTVIPVAEIGSVDFRYRKSGQAWVPDSGSVGSAGVNGAIPAAYNDAEGTYEIQFIPTFTDGRTKHCQIAEVRSYEA